MLYFAEGDALTKETHPVREQYARCRDEFLEVASGPNGRPGMMYRPVHLENGPMPHFDRDEDEQVWLETDPSTGVWIGRSRKSNFNPRELMKPNAIRGYLIEDDYGQKWQIPIARSERELASLPKRHGYSDDHKLKESLAYLEDEYLFEVAGQVVDWVQEGGQPWTERVPIAIKALNRNYFFTPEIVRILDSIEANPLTDKFVNDVLLALIDQEMVEEAKKKS